MIRDYRLHNRKAETSSMLLCGVVRSEQALALLGCQAMAGIGYAQLNFFINRTSSEGESAAIRHRIHCVQYKIGERAVQQLWISAEWHRLQAQFDAARQRGLSHLAGLGV